MAWRISTQFVSTEGDGVAAVEKSAPTKENEKSIAHRHICKNCTKTYRFAIGGEFPLYAHLKMLGIIVVYKHEKERCKL